MHRPGGLALASSIISVGEHACLDSDDGGNRTRMVARTRLQRDFFLRGGLEAFLTRLEADSLPG